MSSVRRFVSAAICLLLPSFAKPPLLRLLGHRVGTGVRIAPSFVLVGQLSMASNSTIGPLNFVRLRRLVMRSRASLGYMNYLNGNFAVRLGERASIGNRNTVNRGPSPPQVRSASLWLGTWSKITAGHYVNIAETISIGEYSTIAGWGTQLWTHGFVHMRVGLARAEVRGKIMIGNNVYVGSQSCLNPGITIADGVAIGSHSSVSKSLLKPGLYVSQPLRYIPTTPEERLASLSRIEGDTADDTYYWREDGK
jgi:UDP-3-O-[3-hydroxymyristoyl] glucosamine N-acyltransferase